MKTQKTTLQKVWSKVDQKELVDLAMTLVNSHSPTGSEEEVARICVDWLNKRGIPAFYQEVEPGRGNVVGTLKGTGGGPMLMYNCHLDTALSGDPTDVMFAGKLRPEWLSQARRKGTSSSAAASSTIKAPSPASWPRPMPSSGPA